VYPDCFRNSAILCDRAAGTAVHYNFAITGNFGEALRHVVLRNQLAADLGYLELVGLADVGKKPSSPASRRALILSR